MGTTKYAVPDVQAFDNAMLAACSDDEQRAVVYILSFTGMHVSSLLALGPQSVVRKGGIAHIVWVRPKTGVALECPIPKDRVELVEKFCRDTPRRPSRDAYNFILKKVGRKAGYPDASPMTFRHNYCSRLIEQGESLLTIPSMMGCSAAVATRNYAKRRQYEHFEQSQTDEGI